MRVYKFLSCQYGLRVIRERRLKISEVSSLNDPYELLPFDLSDPTFRQAVIASRIELGRNNGILCFSQYWHNPVLWAHYAESHKGLCLGFDVPDGQRSVSYEEHPIKLTPRQLADPDLRIAEAMVFTKYAHWQYEDEVRIWATLNEKSGRYFFKDFDDGLRLVVVICGAASHVSERKILQALGAKRNDVRILKARLAFDAFRVVEDEGGFGSGPA
jgi:hypothetical protein